MVEDGYIFGDTLVKNNVTIGIIDFNGTVLINPTVNIEYTCKPIILGY